MRSARRTAWLVLGLIFSQCELATAQEVTLLFAAPANHQLVTSYVLDIAGQPYPAQSWIEVPCAQGVACIEARWIAVPYGFAFTLIAKQGAFSVPAGPSRPACLLFELSGDHRVGIADVTIAVAANMVDDSWAAWFTALMAGDFFGRWCAA